MTIMTRVPGSGRKSRDLVLTSVYLPREVLDILDSLADQFDVKRSDTIRAAIVAGLARNHGRVRAELERQINQAVK